MKELIEKLKTINNLNELDKSINTNALIYAILRSGRYDLLENSNIKINIYDKDTLEKLIKYLLDDNVYFLFKYGFTFSKEELECIFNLVLDKYNDSYELDNFFNFFFKSDEELNSFVNEHKQFFDNYLKEHSIVYSLLKCDSFIKLILENKRTDLIKELENYSIDNLKLIVKLDIDIPYTIADDRYAKHLFDLKDELNYEEFCKLLASLKDDKRYNKKKFTNLIEENINYLIEAVTKSKIVPMCLRESSLFRDACIKENRMDLAVKCILPNYLINNEKLTKAYAKELSIDDFTFIEEYKYILDYSKINDNIFNSILTTSLNRDIFNLNKEHYERFINDLEIQMAIEKLNTKELSILNKILDMYSYKEYDVSLMISNIINNLKYYPELINSLDIQNISNEDIRKLVSILQLNNNPYKINNLDNLKNYEIIKKEYFLNNINSGNLSIHKDNLLKLIFNIDLKEALYIDNKYCYDNDNNCMLENLKNSELPRDIYNYLVLIDKIIKCDNIDYLKELVNNINVSYTKEIPLEIYLRSVYTKLYSQTLYKIDEKNQVYGPKDNILKEVNYQGKRVEVCIPRVYFNFLIHRLGSCSTQNEISNTNYRSDWLDRPQMQDHFVACSYINEKGLYSIRAYNSIILGFDSLEDGAILGMGNTDIDSLGRDAMVYGGSRKLQEGNKNRAKFYTPSQMLKTINQNYNEIVIERRNMDKSKGSEIKRKPDYIIMMAESLDSHNFNNLETLYQNELTFVSEEDKKIIKKEEGTKKIKELLNKYQLDNNLINTYISLINKAKYFEDCLKASSEFAIPLVVIDKKYYFMKMLNDSVIYDEDEKESILKHYEESNEDKRKRIFNMVALNKDVTSLISNNNLKI